MTQVDELFLQEIVREAVLGRDIISTLPSGETSRTPFWKARWMIQRAQEEREWDCRQHDSRAAWEEWLASWAPEGQAPG